MKISVLEQNYQQMKLENKKECVGCLAKDILLQGQSCPIAAQDVRTDELLLTRDGIYKTVLDIKYGSSSNIYQLTLSCGYTIRLTGDHTLCRADGMPVVASNVRPGDELQIFRTDMMKLDSSQVISVEEQPYEDTVYNFVFDEPTFLVAQGIVAGDHEYQQIVKPKGRGDNLCLHGLRTGRRIYLPFGGSDGRRCREDEKARLD